MVTLLMINLTWSHYLMGNRKGFLCKRIGGEWTLVVYYHNEPERVFIYRSQAGGRTFEAFAKAVMSIDH